MYKFNNNLEEFLFNSTIITFSYPNDYNNIFDILDILEETDKKEYKKVIEEFISPLFDISFNQLKEKNFFMDKLFNTLHDTTIYKIMELNKSKIEVISCNDYIDFIQKLIDSYSFYHEYSPVFIPLVLEEYFEKLKELNLTANNSTEIVEWLFNEGYLNDFNYRIFYIDKKRNKIIIIHS